MATSQLTNRSRFPQDLTGFRFGRLVVLGRADAPSMLLCLCDCGKKRAIQRSNLLSGNTKACGCLRDEIIAEARRRAAARRASAKAATARRREEEAPARKMRQVMRQTWRAMIGRCTSPRNSLYPNYGGRGIRVCGRWLNSFDAFCADVGPRPSPAHSIDRINNDGNYEPGNVRWATIVEQNNNRRTRRDILGKTLTHAGLTLRVSQWAKRVGITEAAMRYRLAHGWDVPSAVTTPKKA